MRLKAVLFVRAIAACRPSGDLDVANEIFQKLLAHGVRPGWAVYIGMMEVAVAAGESQEAVEWVRRARRELDPARASFHRFLSRSLTAFAHPDHWQEGLELFEEYRVRGVVCFGLLWRWQRVPGQALGLEAP